MTRSTITEARTTLVTATGALESARSTFDLAGTQIGTQVPRLSDEASAALRSADTAINEAADGFGAVTGRVGTAADTANARLTELGDTLTALDAALGDAHGSFGAVTAASDAVEALVTGTGSSLVDEARSTLQTLDDSLSVLNQTVARDVPRIAADVRTATAARRQGRGRGRGDARGAARPARPAGRGGADDARHRDATPSCARSRASTGSMPRSPSADRTFAAAEGAFTGAEAVIGQEVAPAAADIRAAAESIQATMAEVTRDLPAIAADLRETAARARAVAETVEVGRRRCRPRHPRLRAARVA